LFRQAIFLPVFDSKTGEIVMKKQTNTSLALGSIVAATLFSPAVFAGDNPFAVKQLDAGYQLAQADKKVDGKCGEAKCGAEKKMDKKQDGKCGEAKCGSDKKKDKKADGKCGEAKCGAKK
jgi:uncharacterized low-complexity protein